MADASCERLNGKWRWVAETARYVDPTHATIWSGRVNTVTVKNGVMRMENEESYSSGATRTWVWEGPFDGVARLMTFTDNGEAEMNIAFSWIGDGVGGDIYVSGDGRWRGAEYFAVSGDRWSVWGCITENGQQHPYFEEWERVG